MRKILNYVFCYKSYQRGFTLIELSLVMGVFAILSTFVMMNLINPQARASLNSAVSVLASDLKEQQLRSMVGDSAGQGSAQTFGIYFQGDRYIIFRGTSFVAGDPGNFEILIGSDLSLIINLPPSSEIIFSRRSGEVAGFDPTKNSILVRNNTTGEQRTITINKLGTIILN